MSALPKSIILLVLIAASLAYNGIALSPCLGSVPPSMSYQGKLTNIAGQPVPDGNRSMRFYIYNAESGGSLLWQEPASGDPAMSVPVIGGIFNVILGSVVSIPYSAFQGSTWLQTEVDGELLSPRAQIVSVGYAVTAKNLDMPFSSSITSTGAALSVTNTGGGQAGYFAGGAGGSNPVLQAFNTGTAPAFKASNSGGGSAGEFNGKLKVNGTAEMSGIKLTSSPTDGYVLTSDASGVGTWKAPGSALLSIPDFINVKDYGATGNGVTDDTYAIQAAFDAAPAGGRGCVVYFPAGDYKITSALRFTSSNHANFTVCGVRGRDSVWKGSSIIFYGTSGTMLDLRDGDFFEIRDLRLDGRNLATTAIFMGLSFSGSHQSHILIEDLTIQNINGTAIDTGDVTGIADSTIKSTIIEMATIGIDIKGQGIKVFGGTIAGCSEAGVKIWPASSAPFYGTTFSGNGIDVKYTGNDAVGVVSFTDVWFENSLTAIFKRPDVPSITKGISDIRFDGCWFHSFGTLLDLTNCEGHVHIYGGAWDSSGVGTVTIPSNMYLYVDSLFGDQLTYNGPNAEGVYFPLKNYLRCRAHRAGANQSVPNGAWTVVQFNGTDFDTGSKYNPASYRYSPATPGYYLVKAKVQVSSTPADKQYILAIRNSGVTVASSRFNSSAAGQTIDIEVSDIIRLTGSQYIDVILYHNAGTPQDINASTDHSTTYLTIHKIS